MKITIIGGGSYAWAPVLIRNLLTNDFFAEDTICLMDINTEALDDIHALAVKYNELAHRHFTFCTSTSMEKSLDGASYVVVAISHGGLEAELEDHRIARKFGFYNMKGSEVGIAGAARTLRHVPEMVRIAHAMEQHCPEAMLLNVTNPLTALTRSVGRYSKIQAAGFCHGVVNHLAMLLPYFSKTGWDGVEFNVAGVDHISWLLDVRYRGQDALAIIKKKGFVEAAKKGTSMGYDDPFAGKENLRLRFLIWDIIGYLPALSDEHCIEFFGQIMGSAQARTHYHISYDRMVERTRTVHADRTRVKDLLAGKRKLEIVRGGEIIDQFIAALHGGTRFLDVINYPNEGQISNLPLYSVVETKCLVDSTGVHPVHAGALPPILESIVRPVCIREELYMEAAMEKDVQKLKAALATDPIVNDFRRMDEIANVLLKQNRSMRSKKQSVK